MATGAKKSDREWQKNHSNLRNRGFPLSMTTAFCWLRQAREAAKRRKRQTGRAAGKVSVRMGQGEGIGSGGHGKNEHGRGDVFFANRDSPSFSSPLFRYPTRAPKMKPAPPPSEPQMWLRRSRGGYRRVGWCGKRGGRRGVGEPGGVLASPLFVGICTTRILGGTARFASSAKCRCSSGAAVAVAYCRLLAVMGPEGSAAAAGGALGPSWRGRPCNQPGSGICGGRWPPKGKNICLSGCRFLFLLVSSKLPLYSHLVSSYLLYLVLYSLILSFPGAKAGRRDQQSWRAG